ncbi:MAG: rRNA methyltransferase [Alphaproteobacteria bacterium]|nr:rRNA methyltransferase [Alphaproteobacteria bacterium]
MSISSKIDALPPLREIVAQHGLQANKAFGQNYLFDLNLTQKIARLAGDLSGHNVFEIGPGPGGLTRALLTETSAAKIIAVEKDGRFITALHPLIDVSDNRLELIEGDALKIDLTLLAPAPRAVVANLPYNVGTELLISWLHQPNEFSQFVLMFQKEVAQRIVAKQNTKEYGRLAVLVQNLCTAEIVLTVPPSAFTPAPKVTSSVIRIRPKADTGNVPIKALEKITAAAFGQRRKMLRQSMKAWLPQLEEMGIDPQKRAEDLSVGDFLRVAQLTE